MGAWQWALVNSKPRLAKRSIFGVDTCGCPPRQLTQSFRSSIAMNSTFGRLASVAHAWLSATSKPSATSANHRIQLIQRFFALAADRFFETFFPAPRRHKYPYRKKTCGFSAKPDSQTAAGRSACSDSRPDKSSAAHSSQSARRASPPHTPWADFSGSPYGSPLNRLPPILRQFRQIPVNRSCLALHEI